MSELQSELVASSDGTNVIQLSKPFVTSKEIAYLKKTNIGNSDEIRAYSLKKRETFEFLIRLVKRLHFPVRILQYCSYLYQRFFLFSTNFTRDLKWHMEIGLTALFISMKMNDFIKKLTFVLQESNTARSLHLSPQELESQRRTIMGLEKTMMECESFDFRNYCMEDLLVKFTKFFKLSEMESYISWSILNDLYLTELPLELPAHHNAIIAMRTALLILSSISNHSLHEVDLHKINMRPDNDSLILGVHQMLEHYIDNYPTTFLKDAMLEIHIDDEPKELVDKFLTVKIDFAKKFPSPRGLHSSVPDQDLLFQPHDSELGKHGCIRFLYNKKKYLDEVSQ
ncbi:hypothetical protein HII13_003060 [Brettanomyces bruxellensis]|nr:hypothetical protein HII13_003060 [Brettanomyces bruxellensis]